MSISLGIYLTPRTSTFASREPSLHLDSMQLVKGEEFISAAKPPPPGSILTGSSSRFSRAWLWVSAVPRPQEPHDLQFHKNSGLIWEELVLLKSLLRRGDGGRFWEELRFSPRGIGAFFVHILSPKVLTAKASRSIPSSNNPEGVSQMVGFLPVLFPFILCAYKRVSHR